MFTPKLLPPPPNPRTQRWGGRDRPSHRGSRKWRVGRAGPPSAGQVLVGEAVLDDGLAFRVVPEHVVQNLPGVDEGVGPAVPVG